MYDINLFAYRERDPAIFFNDTYGCTSYFTVITAMLFQNKKNETLRSLL